MKRPGPTQSAKKIHARLLLIDDDPDVRMILRHFLKKEGVAITVVASGSAALEILDREHFDLVVTDLLMPKIDGFGLLWALRDKDAAAEGHIRTRLPVLVISSSSQRANRQRALDMGAVGFVEKPLDPDALRETVSTLLGTFSARVH